jgi:hypothetical protein
MLDCRAQWHRREQTGRQRGEKCSRWHHLRLPPLLCHNLTTHPTALKKHHDTVIKERWKAKWQGTTRGEKMAELDSTTPSKNFLSTISNGKLTQQASSLLTQLCIGHIPLNGYLYRFKLVDSPRCLACGATTETIPHFLLICPSYAHECWPLSRKIGKTPTVKDFMDDCNALHLFNYIEAIGCFNHTGTYIRPDQ